MDGHAAEHVSKYMHIQRCMQNLIEIEHRNPELDQFKALEIIDFSRQIWLAWRPSPVLLFESKPIRSLLYESCATSGKPSTWLPLGGLVEQA